MRTLARLKALLESARSPDAGPPPLSWDEVVVVFTRSDRDVARLDIASGPCVRSPGRSRPLVGVTNQLTGAPVLFESLFRVLVSDLSGGPWVSSVHAGRGRLDVFSDPFLEALAALNREAIRRGADRPRDYDWIFEPQRAVFRQWMPEIPWPVGSDQVPGMAAELGGICAWARVAQERGQRLYCWSGPGFNPWTITAGQADRLIETVRRRAGTG